MSNDSKRSSSIRSTSLQYSGVEFGSLGTVFSGGFLDALYSLSQPIQCTDLCS